jgi:hypothetical protein
LTSDGRASREWLILFFVGRTAEKNYEMVLGKFLANGFWCDKMGFGCELGKKCGFIN